MEAVEVQDIDRGYAAAAARVKKLRTRETFVKVGVSDVPHEPTGIPTDEIGAAHEFGLGHVPQRSFLRAWADDTGRMRTFTDLAERLMNEYVAGEMSLPEALKALGAWAVSNVRQRIRVGLAPPLDPKTVDRKVKKEAPLPGFPLLDTLQLEEAIIYETSQS
jgi:hypothetical protein